MKCVFRRLIQSGEAITSRYLKQGIQDMKLAGCRSGQILCSEDDPSTVLVLLEWESKEHHLRWRGTPPHTQFRAAVEEGRWQTKPSRGGYYLAETI